MTQAETIWNVQSEAELNEVVAQILPLLQPGTIVTLEGQLGVGKTTLVQLLCKSLGVAEAVTSPTYALVNLYQAKEGMIQHLDLYRLNSIDEAMQMGLEEYLASDRLTFIEWPEIAYPLLPSDCVQLKLEMEADEARKIVLLTPSAGDNDRS